MPSAKQPPGPKNRVPGESLYKFRRDPLGYLESVAREYGDVVRFSLFKQSAYLLNHPDLVRELLVTHAAQTMKSLALQRAKAVLGEGLLTSEGEFHLRQRRLSQPAFHRQRVGSYGEIMSSYAVRASDGWHDGQALNITEEMMRLTMAIVAKALFDADVDSEAREIREALTVSLRMFRRLMMPYSDLILKLPLPIHREFRQALARLDKTIYRIIEARRADPRERADLLSMLLEAHDSEGDGGRMTDVQLRDELMTLFLAGHETTSNALSWTWYLLAQNPEAEARLHQELDTVLEGRRPAADDLPRLPFATQVFSEAMRLYPPAWIMGRKVLKDFEAGGYHIPAGSIVFVSQWVLHRDPRFWENPLKFDPDRWTPEAVAARPKFCYFPFGAGPRRCIGEPFAWMEGVLLLATLAQKWRFELMPRQRIELQPLITLRPKHGIRVKAIQRTPVPQARAKARA